VAVCKPKKGSKLAIELDPELSIVRHEPDLVDQLAAPPQVPHFRRLESR
jgi:hypothetical protein